MTAQDYPVAVPVAGGASWAVTDRPKYRGGGAANHAWTQLLIDDGWTQTNDTEREALNTCFTSLESILSSTGLIIIAPVCGSAAADALKAIKIENGTAAAFDMTHNGTAVYSQANGIAGDGATKYISFGTLVGSNSGYTHIINPTDLGAWGYVSNGATSSHIMGAAYSTTDQFRLRNDITAVGYAIGNSGFKTFIPGYTEEGWKGLFTTPANDLKIQLNDDIYDDPNVISYTAIPGNPQPLRFMDNPQVPSQKSNMNHKFWLIAQQKFSEANALAVQSAIEAFQVALGRSEL